MFPSDFQMQNYEIEKTKFPLLNAFELRNGNHKFSTFKIKNFHL